ncbi:MAG TPA: hypothetical protein DEA08_20515 [Planctomycetes bacterium]|nr:hypothetical protein [Planctomycetota bacterium]
MVAVRGRKIEVDFADGRRQLAHLGPPERLSPFAALDELLLALEGAGLLDWIEGEDREITFFRPWRDGHHSEPELPERLDPAARARLRVILSEDTGGVACAWFTRGSPQVVYLSGDGEASCLARSPRDFFPLLGLGCSFMELVNAPDLNGVVVDDDLSHELTRVLGRGLSLGVARGMLRDLAGYESERFRAWLVANGLE